MFKIHQYLIRKREQYFYKVLQIILGILMIIWIVSIVSILFGSRTVVIKNTAVQASTIDREDSLVGVRDIPDLSIEDKIRNKFGDKGEIFISIAKAESGMNTKAYNVNTNKTVDIGLFQINSVHGYDVQKLFDVDYNIQCAYEIYQRQGITAWSSVNNGDYLKFL